MPRVNDALVKGIFTTELDTTPFIATASRMVDNYLANAGLSEETLTDIELYLSAHMASLNDPRLESVKDEGFSAKVQGKTGLGLDATFYGQTVKMLDTSNTLARVGLKRGTLAFVSVEPC